MKRTHANYGRRVRAVYVGDQRVVIAVRSGSGPKPKKYPPRGCPHECAHCYNWPKSANEFFAGITLSPARQSGRYQEK